VGVAFAAVIGACRGAERRAPRPERDATTVEGGTDASAGAVTDVDGRPVVLCLGTSLTAGQGLDPAQAYPALLQEKIDAAGLGFRVVNAGVSGETSAGARRRVGWLMRQPVAVLLVETGANDGLRGQDPDATRENIQAILDEARRQRPPPRPLLAGMEAPPNYGSDYRRRFRAIYTQLAARNGVALVPFLLDGVAGDPRLNQPDGIHPTAEGQRRVADNVWKVLRPVLTATP
jgi:acyl-CoA thioesterase-1